MSKPDVFTDVFRIVILVAVLASLDIISNAESADAPPALLSEQLLPEKAGQTHTGLSLFMSPQDQEAAEIRKSNHSNIVDSNAEAENDSNTIETDSELKLEAKSLASNISDKTKSVDSVYGYPRYDGVVLRNGEVLGMWVNNQRFVVTDPSGELRVESVSENGQAVFYGTPVVKGHSLKRVLSPGDRIPFEYKTIDSSLSAEEAGTGQVE